MLRRIGELPRYEVQGTGPDHARRYRARVLVAGAERGMGEGRSKKDAEQAAARVAWAAIAERTEQDPGAPAEPEAVAEGAGVTGAQQKVGGGGA